MKADMYLHYVTVTFDANEMITTKKKYVTKYVYMYNFSRFCYIVTYIALSVSSITQDEHTYYCVLVWYDSSFYVVDKYVLSRNKQTQRVNDLTIVFFKSTFLIAHIIKTFGHYGSIFFNIDGCISGKFPAYVWCK